MRIGVLVGAAALVAGSVVSFTAVPSAVAAPRTPTSTPTRGGYTAVSATRVLDTRHKVGVGTTTPVASKKSVTFTVAGQGTPSVPAGASAVVLNLTATGATAGGYLTAYAAGGSLPGVSNVNFAAGQTKPNLAVVPLSSTGQVTVYNGSAGSVHVLADLSGFYTGGTPATTQQGAFGRVTPQRLLDTRQKIGVTTTTPVKARSTVTFQVEGRAGVPNDVAAVALNITATGGTAGGYITAYASGSDRPATSVLNYGTSTVPALAIVRTGGDGKVTLYNGSSGTVHLLADVQGYYTAGDPVAAGDYAALPPARALSAVTIAPGATYTGTFAGKVGVPKANLSTVFATVTVAHATRGGYLTVYDGAGGRPTVSNVNFVAGVSVANLVAAPSPSGTVKFYNGSSGTVQVYADVTGYAAAADPPLPGTSAGHYVRTLSAAPGKFADQSQTGVGCQDARAGDQFVLLDIGGQFKDSATAAPYVKLSATSTKATYAQLVTAIKSYVNGYVACDNTPTLTLLVGTNNDGSFPTYSAADMGTDSADQVVDKIGPVEGITVRAANDIEAGFVGNQTQALQWIAAYLNATEKDLVFNGSADDCPDTYDAARANCAYGWTQDQYRQMTHSGQASTVTPNADRIQALPQIYTAGQARQWTNIQRLAGGVIQFAGSLTENAAGPCDLCDLIPPQGWAFLYHGLSTVSTSPSLPVAADLDIVQ